MKTPQDFSAELKRRFTDVPRLKGLQSIANGAPPEGFIQAGVYVGLIDNPSASVLEDAYYDVFQQPMSTAAKSNTTNWQLELRDYSLYDTPAYLRAPE